MNQDQKNTPTSPSSINNTGDLQDSQHDKERMRPESVVLDLPEVKDIEGQEYITPLLPVEMADTTISSDDEEGVGLFDDDDETDIKMGIDNVSKTEKKDLKNAAEAINSDDDINLQNASLDVTDAEGTLLNEESSGEDVTGKDLDIPGSELDDRDENIGEEDEENNVYSEGDNQ
ncbi:MAG: hypothetical protein H0W12_07295 [Chitinophagaceae bacterium]|nr:hypothetical protein [Chitinophagaceae bacterium]HEV8081840.1 hypothetical protein [Chitinophagaceae bacterium]